MTTPKVKDFPQAKLTYEPNKLSPYHYQATCPEHHKSSSIYLGPSIMNDSGRVTWKFRCLQRINKGKNKFQTDHVFVALPDKRAPKDVGDVGRWIESQRQERISKDERKRK